MSNRDQLLAAFRGRERPLIGAGAGTGLSARAAAAGGADFLVVYNSGRYRMAGRSSLAGLLAYGDANQIVQEMAAEIVPVSDVPVLAGVNGTDPFRSMPGLLLDLAAAGYRGVQNFPTVGAFDGVFRTNLEGTGLGYDREVEMMRHAGELDLLTMPYCFDADEAVAMIDGADVDVVVAHLGLTTSGSVGAPASVALDDAAEAVGRILAAARRRKPGVIVLAHGGPIAAPTDWQFVLERTEGLDGFLGASSMERLPVEAAIADTVAAFGSISRPAS